MQAAQEKDVDLEVEAIETDITEPEVEVIEPKEQKPDTLREALSKAYDKVEKERDASGKFKKKQDVTEEKPIVVKESEQEVKKADAPRSWAKDKHQVWEGLAPDAKEYIAKREDEMARLASRLDEDRNVGVAIKQIFDPYMPMMQQAQANPFQVVNMLLDNYRVMKFGSPEAKSKLVKQLITEYNVQLDSAENLTNHAPASHAQATPYVDGRIEQLEKMVKGLPQTLQQEQLRFTAMSELEKFEKSAPEHYQRLKPAMASLLESGQASGLQEAYDKALRLDDDLYQQTIEQKLKAAEQERIEKAKQKVLAAKKAASSIHGSPASTAAVSKNDSRPLRSVLSDAYDSVMNSKI